MGTPSIAEAATIKISHSQISIPVNTTKQLSISGTSKKVTWTSSKKSIATVNSIGIVTAKTEGTATISATVSGKTLKCKVTAYIPMSISNSSLTLNAGKTDKLEVIGAVKTPSWSSSNKAIAQVSKYGTVTGVSKGTAVITATIGARKLTSKVTVIDSIAISNKTLNLEEGQTQSLKIKGISYRSTWTTSNSSVAIVSMYGTVTALKAGKSTITAYVDGEKLSCTITVTKASNITENSFVLKTGKSSPSLNPPIITVSPVNSDITTVTGGAITVENTVSSENTITVDNNVVTDDSIPTDNTVVTDTATTTENTDVTPSPSATPTPSPTPSATPTPSPTIQWESSNTKVATVSNIGTVKGLKSGTAVITATYGDQKYTYLAIIISNYNSYLSKAPFSSYLESYDKVNFVLPTSWDVENHHYPEQGISIATSGYDGSSIIMSVFKNDKYAPAYNLARKDLKSLTSLDNIKYQYEYMLLNTGLNFSIKNFKQSDFQTDHGKVLKTQFTVKIDGESIYQTVYDFYLGKYYIELVVTDLYNDENLQEMGEYILNSITINN